ncbi:MAG: hypothetical protein M1830_006407 [Pleopsidium flavum]|nr:MAG: hypothetical protein M1830_006407 [Pleopsidium flavum]
MVTWTLGDKMKKVHAHHASTRALWELEWRPRCVKRFYPFNYSDVADFDDVFDELVKKNINNAYDDAWTKVFLSFMKRFEQRAAEAEAAHEPENASKIYLRAASLGQISRFPILSTPLKREAFWKEPVTNVIFPHTHAANGDGPEIHMFVRLPQQATEASPAPCLLYLTGLDGYRTDTMPGAAARLICLQVQIPPHLEISPALAYKFGYTSVEDMETDAQGRFSLLDPVFWTSLVHERYL